MILLKWSKILATTTLKNYEFGQNKVDFEPKNMQTNFKCHQILDQARQNFTKKQAWNQFGTIFDLERIMIFGMIFFVISLTTLSEVSQSDILISYSADLFSYFSESSQEFRKKNNQSHQISILPNWETQIMQHFKKKRKCFTQKSS